MLLPDPSPTCDVQLTTLPLVRQSSPAPEPPQAAEFLQKRPISDFFGFQWQNLAEILSLFKKYNNLRKVAVREKV